MMHRLYFCAVVLALLAPAIAAAQGPQQGPQGGREPIQRTIQNNENKDQPVQIDAAALKVQDKDKKATFTGDVQVVQGDTTMKCQTLVVYYGEEMGIAGATPEQKPVASTGPKTGGNAQNIRRIVALGGVTVVTKDQSAKGDNGEYDLLKKTITLTGNVTVSQGQNVIRGEQVVVNTITGNATIEAAKDSANATPPRVRALIQTKGQGGAGGEGNMMTIGPGRTN
jgi:lipopolysaccharide export system protein LptA